MAIGRDDESAKYSQYYLLHQINNYLAKLKRPLWSTAGYCHGISTVWLQKMTDRKEHEFYAVIKRIIDCPADKLQDLDDDIDVQKFLAQIEFAQNASSYGLRQIDVDKMLGVPSEIYRNDYFSIDSFVKYINAHLKDNLSISVGGNHHTIGMHFRDNKFYVFDANYPEGEAKVFDNLRDAAVEMSHCLHQSFGIHCPQWMTLRLVLVHAIPSPPYTRPAVTKAQTVTSPALPAVYVNLPSVTLFSPVKLVMSPLTVELREEISVRGEVTPAL